MHQVEPLQPEHAQPPACEMEQRGAAHPAEAEHDHIVWVQSSSSECGKTLTPASSNLYQHDGARATCCLKEADRDWQRAGASCDAGPVTSAAGGVLLP